MNYAEIKALDIANGEGIRVSLFVSGCPHRCKGCFNPETWDFSFGGNFNDTTIERIAGLMKPSYISGLSLLGGEPFYPGNQRALLRLARRVRHDFPHKNIWAYTGYIFERDILRANGSARCEATQELLRHVSVLVDGPFIESRKNISLRFMGSDNQRIIDVRESLRMRKTVLWNSEKAELTRSA